MSFQDQFHHLRNMGNAKLGCGRDLMDLMTYKGVTFWHFFLYRISQSILRLDSTDRAFRLSNKERCVLWAYPILSLIYDAATLLLCRASISLSQRHRFTERPFKIVFVSHDLTWREISTGGKTKKTDSFFDSILEAVDKRGDIQLVGTYPISLSMSSLRVLIDKLLNWELRQAPFNVFWSFNIWRDESKCHRHFSKLWPRIKEDRVFNEMLNYEDISRYGAGQRFEYYFKVVLPHIFKYTEMAESMIDVERPDLIMLLNEYSDFERSLVIAAKKKGVPTLALQHGAVTPLDFGYIYRDEDKGKVALPDITCVYGRYHFDLLTRESIYSPEQVLITGQPRYDVMHDAGKLFSRADFLGRLKIDDGNKIILWATQSHWQSDEENIQDFNAVFKALDGMPGVTLIIKPHPGEGERYVEMARSCAKNYSIDLRQVDKLSNTFELLYMCDLLIAKTLYNSHGGSSIK